MFRSRFRKVIRDVGARKGRTILVSIAIFIGVLGVVTLVSSGDLMIRQLRKDLQEDKLAMIRTYVSVPKDTPLDNAAYLQALSALPGVTVVQGNTNYPISWKLPGEVDFTEGYIRTFSSSLDQVRLEPPRLIEGSFPKPGGKEVAIEMRMAQRYSLKVGDPLVLRVLGAASESGGNVASDETWTISGILLHAYTYFGTNAFVPNNVSLYAEYADAQYIGGFTGFDSIYTRFTDYPTARQESETLVATIRDKTPYIVVFNWTEDPADNLFIKITRQYTGIINILALVAMIVSGFLVTNVISAIVLEQSRQIGVMKSLGATRWDNFLMYAGIALTYGLIGLVPGVLLGIPLGYQLGKLLAGFANSMITQFSISVTGITLGIGLGLLVPVLASLGPVYRGTKVTILQAMTDLGISTNYGAGRTARLIAALPLPINFRQALSNVVQKKGRLALTIVTLTLAVSAFMGVYAVFDNLNKVLGGIYDAYGFEIQVTPAQLQNFDQIKALLQSNVSGIQDVYPAVGLSIPVEGYKDTQLGTNQLGVLGIDPRTDAFKLNLQAGTAWKDNPERPGIVITSSVADKLKKKLGDKLVVLFGGKKTELEIIGIDRFAFDQAFMEWHALARLGSIGLNAPIPNRYTLPVQVAGYSGSMPGGQVIVVGFDTQVGAFLTFASGSLFIPGQAGIIISQDMAAKGGYRVGDRLNLSVGSNTKDYPITGIFSLPPQMTAQGSPSEIAGMYWEDLAALEGRSLAGEPAPNTLLVRLTNSNATVAQVDEVVKAISKLLVDHGITATFVNQVEQAQQTAQQVLSMGVIFNMTALVMAAVGAIGLLSSLSMSVFERQKEIGVMRSIGAGSGTIAGQFLVEGILVGIIAWLVGVPLSYLFGQGLMKALPFGSFIKFTYSPSGLLIGLIGMIVIATISSLWPSINAARKTVSDILRYQ